MDFPNGSLPGFWLIVSWLLFGWVLFRAVWYAPWKRLQQNEYMHVFLGATVAVMFLWLIKGGVSPGLSFHLLGVTTLTLMFGPALALIAVSLVVVGSTLNGMGGWESLALNVLVMGLVPIVITQWLLNMAQWWLPHNFFVYVLLNAFFAAGLSSLLGKCLAALLLVWSGTYSYDLVSYEYLPYLPLMFFSEALTNGMIMTMLVALRPNWVCSFDDEMYIKGK